MQGTCERYAQIIRALCKTMEDDCPVSLARQRHVSQAGLATISGSAVASRRQGLVLTGAISVNRLPAGFLACISFLLDFIVPLLRLVRVRTLILILIRVVLLVLLRALILSSTSAQSPPPCNSFALGNSSKNGLHPARLAGGGGIVGRRASSVGFGGPVEGVARETAATSTLESIANASWNTKPSTLLTPVPLRVPLVLGRSPGCVKLILVHMVVCELAGQRAHCEPVPFHHEHFDMNTLI